MSFEVPVAKEENLPEGFDAADNGLPTIDSCTMDNVGWMKVLNYTLIPRTYSLLLCSG